MKRKFATLFNEIESETEFQSLLVSNYHLVDNDEKPVCFSVLPVKWSDPEVSKVDHANKGLQIYLHGYADNGLQKIFMQVIAWKFDLLGLKPEVSLLSKDKRWIKLEKPRKSFQNTVKTVLITLYFLRWAKKNPRLSVGSFWSNLCKDKDLSSYGFRPSQKDLLDHMSLISEATDRDSGLGRSKLLLAVLGDKPEDQKPSDEKFDTNNDIIEEADEDSKVEDDLFDSICALCDNGGNLIMCDGACMRSFHATKADGRESLCDSLGFTKKEVDDIETFYCKNCEYHQHQCFACGELGSSDKDKDAEVLKCASETCDRFYHPNCIAKLLPPVVKHCAEDLEKNIVDGKPFPCPIHFCCVCKGLENKMEPELQFAVCNRCPKSYHRKCLPTEITFDDIDGVATRAWEGLLPNNRILIYCLNHEISDELGTPVRDHIKFPNNRASVRKINTSNKKMKPTTTEGVKLKSNVDFVKSPDKSTAEASKVTGKLPSSKTASKKSYEEISDKLETPVRDHIKFPDTRATVPEINTSNKKMKPTTAEGVKLKSNVDFVKSSGKSTAEGSKVTGKLPSSKIARKSSEEISDKLETPVRDHTKFSDTRATVPEINTSNKLKPTTTEGVKLKSNVDFVKSSDKSSAEGSKVTGKLPSSKIARKKSSEETSDMLETPVRDHTKFPDTRATVPEINTSNKRMKPTTTERVELKYNVGFVKSSGKSTAEGSKVTGKLPSSKIGSKMSSEKKSMPKCEEKKNPTGQKLCASTSKGSEQIKHDSQVDVVDDQTLEVTPIRSVFRPPNADSEKGLVDSFKEARSSILLEGVIKKHKLGDVEDKAITMRKLDDSVDLTTKHKVIAQEHGHMHSDKLAVENNMHGDSGDMLMPNHDHLKSTDDQELASVNESQKKSSHVGNVDQESQNIQEFKMSKSSKTSGKRKRIDNNDRRELGASSQLPKEKGVVSQAKRRPVKGGLAHQARSHGETVKGPSVTTPVSDCGVKNAIENHGCDSSRVNKHAQLSPASESLNKMTTPAADDNHSREEKKPRRESNARQQAGPSGVKDPNSTQNDHLSGCSPCAADKHAQLSVASESLDKMTIPAADDNHSREEKKHRRESNARQQAGPSGVKDPNSTQNDHLSGRGPCAADKHAQLSPASEPLNKINTPAAERILLPGYAACRNLKFALTHSAGWIDD